MVRGHWMQQDKIVMLYGMGWTNGDIAHANQEATGWLPSRSVVSRKLRSLGLPSRRASHRDLIPWRINPEHAHSEIYYALQAVSRERQGIPLAKQDFYRAKWLRDLLTRQANLRVVDYDYTKGWRLVRARMTDTDIIRRPVPVADDDALAPVFWPAQRPDHVVEHDLIEPVGIIDRFVHAVELHEHDRNRYGGRYGKKQDVVNGQLNHRYAVPSLSHGVPTVVNH